jgi:hypothetical protein
MRPSPIIRARIFAYLYYGLRRFNMHSVVELIPLLLHLSLILFFAGLVAFLLPVSTAITALAAVQLFVIFSVYSYLTILPIFHSDCPYRTPLTASIRYVFLRLCALRVSSLLWHTEPEESANVELTSAASASDTPTLTEARTRYATTETAERAERDRRALIWTMKSLTDDKELEPFVEAIPDVIWGTMGLRRLYDEQIQALLRHPDAKLISRIEGLLRSCETGLLPPAVQHRRQISCLKAIWAIAHLVGEW